MMWLQQLLAKNVLGIDTDLRGSMPACPPVEVRSAPATPGSLRLESLRAGRCQVCSLAHPARR